MRDRENPRTPPDLRHGGGQCRDLFRVFFETCLYFSESKCLQLKDCIHLASFELIMRIMRIALIMLSMLLVHDSMLIIQVGSHLTFKRDVSFYGSLDLNGFKANYAYNIYIYRYLYIYLFI